LGLIPSSNCFENFFNESEYISPKGKNEWTPIEELEWNPSPKSKPSTSTKHHHNLIIPTHGSSSPSSFRSQGYEVKQKGDNVKCNKYTY
jgi:hypothetical protein